MTKFTAGNTGTQAVVADADRLVFEGVGKVIITFGHGAHENADAFSWAQACNIVSHLNELGVEAQGDLSAVGWQVIGDWILDYFE